MGRRPRREPDSPHVTPHQPARARRGVWRRAAALALAGALAYANSVSGVLTFDDDASIVENRSIRQLWPLTGALSPPERGEPVAGRPLVNLSFAVNYALHGLDVRGYHVVNVSLHVICALLIFGLVRRTLLLDEASGGVKASGYRAADDPANLAFAAALVWIVHPLLTEAVNYISQRTELMMALFYLLTLYASVRAETLPSRPMWLTIAVTACALGMTCKETMATAPLMVMLYDRVFVYDSVRDALRARWRLYAALGATWLLLAALIWSGPRWESAGFSTGISVWTYLLNQSAILVEYLERVVWPASLVLDYGEPRALALPDVAWQAAVIVVLLVLTGVALAKRPAVGFLAAAFFLVLAPTSSFVPIATEVGAERRMYLSLAAAAVLAIVAMRALWRQFGRPAATMPMAITLAAVCVALAAGTVRRNADYASELTLWRTTLERRPGPRAHRNYATVLKRAGYRDEVIDHLRQSLDGHPEGRYGLGYELYEQGRLQEAITELRRFVREVPSDRSVTAARALTADALLKLGRFGEASQEYEVITKAQPTRAAAWSDLGIALAQSGRSDRAVEALTRAVDLDPRNAAARRNLAAVLIDGGELAAAVAHAEAAARLEPSNAASRFLLGVALSGTGRLDESLAHLRASLELDPSNADAREHIARVERLRNRSSR